ncbi:MAG TPA: hypothetical protein V6C50_07445, partial [Crinalium sp.]
LAGTTATLILTMFCLVNLSLLIIKRREGNADGFQVPAIIPVLAFLSNLVLIAFASKESHILATALAGVGFILVFVRNAFMKRSAT